MKGKNKKEDLIWKIKGKLDKENPSREEIIDVLLENRGLKTKKQKNEFLFPKDPVKISLSEVSLAKKEVDKAIKRLKKAKKKKEKVVVYGDYDADGICATAILWETLYSVGIDTLPYVPERFTEGYGLNEDSLEVLKEENPDLSLVITVDNGITAHSAAKKAKKLGIDLIIADHHQKDKKTPEALSVLHTTKLGGAGISWIFTREIRKEFGRKNLKKRLDLAAMGTISDLIPLLGVNRSIVKYGLEELNKTKRPGLNALFKEASVKKGVIGTYIVGFIITPRLNAMGRLGHAIDSLRLLCTTSEERAKSLARKLGRANRERQQVVDEVVLHARSVVSSKEWPGVITISHSSYHEGVIGLAASRLVEEFYRPAIVISEGKEESKASARSIPGFNIIKAIREFDDMLLSEGGHPMAAGFSIETRLVPDFVRKIGELSSNLLTGDVVQRVLKVDMGIEFDTIDESFYDSLQKFEPTGIGNPMPSFVTKDATVVGVRAVGKGNDHLKLRVVKNDIYFNAIAFNLGGLSQVLKPGSKIDISYSVNENVWGGKKSIELKIKDIKIN